MIVISGAIGFIGSCLIRFLNNKGYHDLILVDNFDRLHAGQNLNQCRYRQKIDRQVYLEWMLKNAASIDMVLHMAPEPIPPKPISTCLIALIYSILNR
jgi:ADP-L-glycero-D-manno-heptose 6-epimerase